MAWTSADVGLCPSARELFAVERLHLKPLPAWIPEVRLQQRLVDIEGYVALNSNRYSVPVDWIGRRRDLREPALVRGQRHVANVDCCRRIGRSPQAAQQSLAASLPQRP